MVVMLSSNLCAGKTPNYKSQDSKQISNYKHQTVRLKFEIWCFEFVCDLLFVIWNFFLPESPGHVVLCLFKARLEEQVHCGTVFDDAAKVQEGGVLAGASRLLHVMRYDQH